MRAPFLVVLGFLLTGCPEGQVEMPPVKQATLTGPSTLPNNGPPETYSVMIQLIQPVTRDTTHTSPFWLWEEDGAAHQVGDHMSFVKPTFPAGLTTTTVTMNLACVDGTVRGTAATMDDGSPNNPDSGEGFTLPNAPGLDQGPAEVWVQFQGKKVSNMLSITCT